MEVGVKVWAEHARTGAIDHVASAYLVFVAIDDQGKPVQIPELLPDTPDQLRRWTDALRRRDHRERESARRKIEALETRTLDESARGSE
jgi:acyl-CoA hydrolase